MCYMKCPYENFDGECRDSKMMGTSGSGCCIDEEEPNEEELNEDNALEN